LQGGKGLGQFNHVGLCGELDHTKGARNEKAKSLSRTTPIGVHR
jgi:hypothetical protein